MERFSWPGLGRRKLRLGDAANTAPTIECGVERGSREQGPQAIGLRLRGFHPGGAWLQPGELLLSVRQVLAGAGADRVLQIAQRAGQVAEPLVCETAIVARTWGLGGDSEREIEAGDRVGPALLLEQRDALVLVREAIGRVDRDRGVVVRERPVDVAGLLAREPAHGERCGEPRPELQGAVEIGDCLRVTAKLAVCDAAGIVRARAGGALDGCAERDQGAVPVELPASQPAEHRARRTAARGGPARR